MPEKSMLLNGTWKFFWCDTPEGIPAHFFNPEFPDKQWGDIKVPSNWEMQGYGDKLFRNVSAPFGVNPTPVPKDIIHFVRVWWIPHAGLRYISEQLVTITLHFLA